MKAETTINQSIKLAKAENRVPRWVLPSVKISIFAIDAVLAFTCFTLAFILRDGKPVFSPDSWDWSKEFTSVCRRFGFCNYSSARNAFVSKGLSL